MFSKPVAFAICSIFFVCQISGQTIDTLINAHHSQLHVKIWKGKDALILFESGGGLDATQWDTIADSLHHHLGATVITYDRAGFGRSMLDTLDYSIGQEIDRLDIALKKLNYGHQPVILVGHSLGAFYNWLFAFRYPQRVKGIILLDPRIPSEEDSRFAREYFQSLKRADFEPQYLSLYYLLKHTAGNNDYLRARPFSRAIPVLDIMAEFGPFDNGRNNERFKRDQREFIGQYKNRKLIIAKGAPHNIAQHQPAFVIDQIERFYRSHMNVVIAENILLPGG